MISDALASSPPTSGPTAASPAAMSIASLPTTPSTIVPLIPIVATGVRIERLFVEKSQRAPGQKAERAPRHRRADRPDVAPRIVDEAVDREPRIGADGEDRAVEQQDLELALAAGAHLVVEADALAQHGGARLQGAGAADLDAVADRRIDPDHLRARGQGGQCGQRRRRGDGERAGGGSIRPGESAHPSVSLLTGRGTAPQAWVTSVQARSSTGRPASWSSSARAPAGSSSRHSRLAWIRRTSSASG